MSRAIGMSISPLPRSRTRLGRAAAVLPLALWRHVHGGYCVVRSEWVLQSRGGMVAALGMSEIG